jgi:creatinine amidohydrolase
VTVHRLEELSTAALDALDRARTLVIITVSPLEEHGPHLPLGVDAFTARHFAELIAGRLVAERSGWSAVLAPTLYLGSFTFEAVGTIPVRQRVVRDAVVDYGAALARAGFRHLLIANGHAGPTHLTALDEAAAIVSRRHGVTMASLSGHLAWGFRNGRFLDDVERALGRPLTEAERQAFTEDAHGGWWETSMMLMLRPDLVDGRYRDLPPATYSLPARLRRNYPLRDGGQGYVGHPAMADVAFARATTAALVEASLELVDGLLDGRLRASARRSPYTLMPFFRTNFWRGVAAATVAVAGVTAIAALVRPRPGRRDRRA